MPFDTRADVVSAPGGLLLSQISPHDKPWDEHRARADRIALMYELTGEKDYARRICKCSQVLGFNLISDENSSGQSKLKLNSAWFCRVRHCPICQWRRSMMWRARMFQTLPRLQEAYPNRRWVFLTLTVANVPLTGLRAAVQKMNKAWQRLAQRKAFPAEAWLKSVEVTRNPSTGEAHPHIHALLMVKSSYFTHGYLSQAEWTKLWKSCLRVDYQPIVHVKAVKSRRAADDPDEALKVAIVEVTKYATKPSDLVSKKVTAEIAQADLDWLDGITKQLHKMRSISIGGVLKDFMSDEEPEDLIGEGEDIDRDVVSDIFFAWEEKCKHYKFIR